MSKTINEARRDQTRREIDRLTSQLDAWYEIRKSKDIDPADPNNRYRGQYDSQLNAIHREVEGAALIIKNEVDNMNLDRPVGDVYDECADHDKRVVWLWRAWGFFREKFDQRDNESFGDTLRAADEVVWSCYKAFFQNQDTKAMAPAPLPYIETDYSPSALRADQMPGSLVKKGDRFEALKGYFDTLPVPIVRIPTAALSSPWSLTLLGHEIGHFIQHAIHPEYPGQFRVALEQAIRSANGSEDDVRAWGRWAPEIFADWYSVVSMGQWAVWVMAQFEIQDNPSMLKRRTSDGYPSPIARLALLAALAEKHGLAGTSILQMLGLDPKQMAAASAEAKRDVEVFVPVVVEAIIKPLPHNYGDLTRRVGFSQQDYKVSEGNQKGGEVDEWSKALLTEKSRNIPKGLRHTRWITAGAAQAWASIMNGADPARIMEIKDVAEREAQVSRFNQKALDTIIASGVPETRGASTVSRAPAEAGKKLADILLQADKATLRDE